MREDVSYPSRADTNAKNWLIEDLVNLVLDWNVVEYVADKVDS